MRKKEKDKGSWEKEEGRRCKKDEKKEVKMVKKKKIVNKTIDLPISQRVQGQLSQEKLQTAVSLAHANIRHTGRRSTP